MSSGSEGRGPGMARRQNGAEREHNRAGSRQRGAAAMGPPDIAAHRCGARLPARAHVLDKHIGEAGLVQLCERARHLGSVACEGGAGRAARGSVRTHAGCGKARDAAPGEQRARAWEGVRPSGKQHSPESKYSRTMSRAAALKDCTLGWKGAPPWPLSSAPGVPGVPAGRGQACRRGLVKICMLLAGV